MTDIEHMSGTPHGMIVIIGLNISTLFSQFVQLVNVKLS